ncbi:MAG: DUF3830 family protein [Mesorhizobium sp.]|uniref:DUF3830 family protein n=1 Tax=Mesorhizobium sp. TaxID=1871066 RepID=UPI000FE69C29|nr:DUF3830 family protein [Mesorhizobium sp.]RWE22865.1 MAG: DUF3830 family protein [Mesorhizobium sp.]
MRQPTFLRIGLKKRGAFVKLRLRWDKSPLTCAAVVRRLPVASQVWHAKWANCEIYTLVPVLDETFSPEWTSAYPAPGDLMYLPIGQTNIKPLGAPELPTQNGLIDFAYFYDRGSNLLNGPTGAHTGNIIATASDPLAVEEFAETCADVWFAGAVGEQLVLDVTD